MGFIVSFIRVSSVLWQRDSCWDSIKIKKIPNPQGEEEHRTLSMVFTSVAADLKLAIKIDSQCNTRWTI